jgi:hypothetical protein
MTTGYVMNAPRLGLLFVKSSSVFGYLVTTWNCWERGKDFGMSLQIRYFTLKYTVKNY